MLRRRRNRSKEKSTGARSMFQTFSMELEAAEDLFFEGPQGHRIE
jgi:hypothetical protein